LFADNAKPTPQCTEVFQVLRRELERRDLLQPPRVFISPGCDSEVQRLREYVRRLQGQLVESPGGPAVLRCAVLCCAVLCHAALFMCAVLCCAMLLYLYVPWCL
jgi:hypothetical protein